MPSDPTLNSIRMQRAYRMNGLEETRMHTNLCLLEKERKHSMRVNNQDIRMITLTLDFIQSSTGHSPEARMPNYDSDTDPYSDDEPFFMYGEKVKKKTSYSVRKRIPLSYRKCNGSNSRASSTSGTQPGERKPEMRNNWVRGSSGKSQRQEENDSDEFEDSDDETDSDIEEDTTKSTKGNRALSAKSNKAVTNMDRNRSVTGVRPHTVMGSVQSGKKDKLVQPTGRVKSAFTGRTNGYDNYERKPVSKSHPFSANAFHQSDVRDVLNAEEVKSEKPQRNITSSATNSNGFIKTSSPQEHKKKNWKDIVMPMTSAKSNKTSAFSQVVNQVKVQSSSAKRMHRMTPSQALLMAPSMTSRQRQTRDKLLLMDKERHDRLDDHMSRFREIFPLESDASMT